nr:reverse transcriptase domain-containing protein [Tanacetum cinerariifolium]
MVGRGKSPFNARRTADRGSDVEQRDPRDIEIERLQQRVRDLEIQREIHDDVTLSNPSDWYDEENPFGARRQNLRGTNRDDPLRNFGMKIEIPEFVGKAHPDEFIDWLSTTRSFYRIPQFSQRASSSVEDFIAEFDRLRLRCDVDEEEEQVIARFLGALQPYIADVVHLQQYLTYEDVCRLALKVEKQQKNQVRTTNSRVTNPSRLPPVVNITKPSSSQQADFGIGTTANPTNARVLLCFKCQGLGHVARECPNK